MRRKRLWPLLVGVVSMMFLTTSAIAHPESEHSDDGVDTAIEAHPEDKQHGGDDGHLPASSSNVELVGKVDLTNRDGGIADVGAFGNYAYLNAFHPECTQRGGTGTGVHVVDVSDPANPTKVAFIDAEPNSYVGEGVHVIRFNGKDILVHNNETCDSNQPVTSGFSVVDVTDPTEPEGLGQYGDSLPAVTNQTFHTTHSVQAFTWNDKAYAVAQDNQDLKDVDIFDITPVVNGTGPAVLVSEVGLEDWPGAQGSYANGDSVFHHDMQQKVIDGHNFLLASYWDAGQVLLNIDDPANPVFVTDSDFSQPDPLTGLEIPEGNSHQSYWSSNGKFVLSSDEDFSPTRTLFEITSGPHAGPYGGGEFGWTVPISEQYGEAGLSGSTVWGGSGCDSDQNGNGIDDDEEVPAASATGADIVVFGRGVCFFSTKVEAGENAGYDAVIIGNSHGGSRNGLLQDGFVCGSRGHEYEPTVSALCIGHRAMHLLFDDEPAFSPPEGYEAGGDMPAIGTLGASVSATTVFDGWGYVHLHDASTLRIIDDYAVPEGLDPDYARGFGNLTVHEVKTDPRMNVNLAYFSYYDAGLRVAKFGKKGIKEVGHYIAEGGNDFWGVYPLQIGNAGKPYLLMSDRDSGLWIFRYTGD
ncbi:MAG: hypothetical protein GEU78_06255 [Actinobacteria bacterium]|nr:hypothetical protein [Actinomycetota bacterium]